MEGKGKEKKKWAKNEKRGKIEGIETRGKNVRDRRRKERIKAKKKRSSYEY